MHGSAVIICVFSFKSMLIKKILLKFKLSLHVERVEALNRHVSVPAHCL